MCALYTFYQGGTMNAKHVKGLKIMSLKQGKKIDEADKILYDSDTHRIKAITVAGGDIRLILFEDVKSIGNDALMVESEESIRNLSSAGEKIERMVKDNVYLIGTTVMTEDGVELGKIADFTFDAMTGKVEEVEISQGPIKDVQSGRKKVAGNDIVTIGKNTTIVKHYIDEKLAEEKEGGLHGMIRGMHEKVSDTTKQVASKIQKKKGMF